MRKNIRKKDAKRSQRRFEEIENKLKAAVAKSGITPEQAGIIKALAGYEGHSLRLLWSDMKAREKAAEILCDCLHRLCAQATETPNFYFLTFTENCGNTSDRAPLFNYLKLKQKVIRAVSKLDVDAIVVMEVHPLINFPREGKGGMLLYHAHALAWTNHALDPDKLKALEKSGAWNNDLGAAPIHVAPVKKLKHLGRMAHYLFKPPHSAKNRMESKKNPGEYLMMDTTRGYRPNVALRVLEGQSQIELLDVVFGVGKGGAEMRQALRAGLVAWHKARPRRGEIIDASFDIWRFWYDFRIQKANNIYLPYRIIGSGITTSDAQSIARPPATPKRNRKSNLARIKRHINTLAKQRALMGLSPE